MNQKVLVKEKGEKTRGRSDGEGRAVKVVEKKCSGWSDGGRR